ncbi:divalent cation tolerance protein [Desulfonatronum thiosulfatophilum]|uniref:Divalent cation tolerance protein n=1 Tax=Desulfonatronum thiosulfatophilum TaxID=617002 RepID=A0A1G6DQC3_9BACT|nr:divalent-cation tolerance protein CutA [Desulfonatronum thiosulfatophilum]SDB47393.1 divalent cation tolerance protein [Desulfonatronum thiosulfatophilum]
MQPIMVYMTAENLDQAKVIARELIENRLAACVNVLEGMRSMYHWEGSIEESREVVVLAKTREELLPDLTRRVREVHTYDCPCIVSWPLTGGHQPFLDWIGKETGAAG